MRKISKAIVFTLGGILAIGALFFLLFVKTDTLIKNIPREAEIYFHTEKNFINNLKSEHKQTFLKYVAQKTATTEDFWQNLLQKRGNFELAGFFQQEELTMLLPAKKYLLKYLQSNQVEYFKSNGVIYFPATFIGNYSFAQNDWVKKQRSFPQFSANSIYIENFNALPVADNLKTPFALSHAPIKADIYQKQNHLQIIFSDELSPNSRNKKLSSLFDAPPSDSLVYWRGIKSDNLYFDLPYSTSSFDYLLFSVIEEEYEYYKNQSGSILILDSSNNLNAIKTKISEIFANLSPDTKIKVLPDQSKAYHLIADPSKWQFVNKSTSNPQFEQLSSPQLGIDLRLYQLNKQIIITKNLNLAEYYDSYQGNTLDLSKYIHNNNLNLAYFNLKTLLNSSSSQHLVFIRENNGKTSICID